MISKAAMAILGDLSGRNRPADDAMFIVRSDLPSYEGNLVARVFCKKTWDQVDASILRDNFHSLPLRAVPAFLTEKGFVYFLPAFLAAVIDAPADMDELSDALYGYCASKPQGEGLLMLSMYSDLERCAIKNALLYIADLTVNKRFNRLVNELWGE